MRITPKARVGLLIGVGVLAAAAWTGKTVVQQARETANAYLYGYPLVLMELTKQHQLANGLSAINQLRHTSRFPDPGFRGVVSPNIDTLYSLSHLDLRNEPVMLEIPETGNQYYMLQVMDAWTNVIISPGTRTIGMKAGQYLFAGPDWRGDTPAGLELVRVPTSFAWMLGRFRADNPSYIAPIDTLRAQFKLRTLSEWKGDNVASPMPLLALPQLDTRVIAAPDRQLATWSRDDFFTTFCQLLSANPAPVADAPMLETIRGTGLLTDSCQQNQSWLQRLGSEIGYGKVLEVIDHVDDLLAERPTYNGWRIAYDIGEYGTDYNKRAVVAKIGLGANLPEDAIYPNLRVDSDNQPLNGSHRYRLHFAADVLPPVNAFWSLTLYDNEQFLSSNPLNRYAIGDRDTLHYNADGSLDLYIQHEAPEEAALYSNWLPAPSSGFNLFLRLYWPKQSALNQSWLPPTIEVLP